MLKNYLAIVWRKLYRQPLHSLLNLICLTVGIAATLLIVLYIDFELNYEKNHQQAEHIYRIETSEVVLGENVRQVGWTEVPRNFGPLVMQDIPGVQSSVRFFRFFEEASVNLKYEGETFPEESIYAADSSLLDVFTFELMQGNAERALDGPNKIMLSESLARRIFGETNPIGQILSTTLSHAMPDQKSDYSLMVSGVYKDMPTNSMFQMEGILSATTDPALKDWYFNRFNTATYLRLESNQRPEKIAADLSSIYEKHLDPAREPVFKTAKHNLVPLRQIHMNEAGGYAYLYTFGGIACLLLLIAMISYVNLVTAQASRRSMEIGVRKVMGANRKQLIVQFLSESLIYTFLSLGLALLLVSQLVEPMNGLLGLELMAKRLWSAELLTRMLGFTFLLGVLGGAYPAFFLSSFQPVSIMKGSQVKRAPIRRMLVAVQFVVVIFVLSCTGMIYEQLDYMRDKDLGFDQEQVLQLELSGNDWFSQYRLLKEELEKHPLVQSVGSANFTPGMGMTRGPISANGSLGPDPLFVFRGTMDYDYPQTIGMELQAGRTFSREFSEDQGRNVVVNEAFLRQFGIAEPGVGEQVKYGDAGNPNSVTIVGVIKDFHQASLHNPIGAQLFALSSSPNVFVKVEGAPESVLAAVEAGWEKVVTDEPFAFNFLDENLQAAYETDQSRGRLFLLFSLLTILIAFLGLFGLASYLASQRVKEIGIRKVLGAGTWRLISMIAKDFVALALLAAIPAFVIAWYFIRQWLTNFAFHADINYILFGLVLLFTLMFTFLTTGWHALRAAQLNPADSLKE